jgi:MscS family membrane protein
MQQLMENFITLIQEVWAAGSFGIGMGNMLLALATFLFFAVLRGLFARFVLGWLGRLTARTKTEIDDMLREAIERPLKFFFVVLGVFFAKESLALTGLPAELADNVMRSLVAIALFWAIYAASTPAAIGLRRIEDVLSPEIVSWLLTVLRWGIILTGLATVLQIWGIQIAPIIAGFGLFGVAVALGAQDLFKNLLGGLSILIEKRFKIGDWVEVPGVVNGTIEHIGFRSTRVRQFKSVPVIVPNNMFSDHALVNHSLMKHRRIYWTVGLEYRTSAAQLETIRDDIMDWLDAHPGFVTGDENVPCFVMVDKFSASSIDMMVYCFTHTVVWEEWLKHKQELALAIKSIVEKADAGFAFPSQSIYVEQLPGANTP